MHRDLDLIAILWVNSPKSEKKLISALISYLLGKKPSKEQVLLLGSPKKLPGGRNSYVINLNRGGYKREPGGDLLDPLVYEPDPQWYLDISVTPLIKVVE